MTNVQPHELNYDSYEAEIYDRDIRGVIPFYDVIHSTIREIVSRFTPRQRKVLDLGCGTGVTASVIRDATPDTDLTLIDFSRNMLDAARARLGEERVTYKLGDYSIMDLGGEYDIITSVIGLHHQSHEGKRLMFRRIHDALTPRGLFLFGDLMRNTDDTREAIATAHHYHHMVQHLAQERLGEWAHHHLYLNNMATVREQLDWLSEVGFYGNTGIHFTQWNTCLLWARKPEKLD